MRISSEIDSIASKVGEERAVELLAKAGFDGWDFSMFKMAKYDYDNHVLIPNSHPLASDNYVEFAKRLRRIGEDNGIKCNQGHAPFHTFIPEIRSYLKRAIECTAIAGGEICVIHPLINDTLEENTEMFLELLPFAKEHGVKIATENTFSWVEGRLLPCACSHHDDFLRHLMAIDDPYFVACLDVGHAEISSLGTSAEDMIFTLGDKLGALHLHDNDKKDDLHRLPYTMAIDFDGIARALKKIGYSGYLTLEAASHVPMNFDKDNAFEGVKELAAAARRIAKAYDEA